MKHLLYAILDVITMRRGIQRTVTGERLQFPARWCRYYPPEYEPEKFAFLREHCKPGATVIDVGAHIGLFTVLMARLVGERGRVHSFEPTPLSRQALYETVRLNGLSSIVQVREEAVSDRTGTAVLYDTGTPISNVNSLVRTSRSRTEVKVALITIDEYVATHSLKVGLLKIDAEGAEIAILRGAEKTLSLQRPAIDLEVHGDVLEASGESCTALWELLESQRMVVRYRGNEVQREWFCGQRSPIQVQILPRVAASLSNDR